MLLRASGLTQGQTLDVHAVTEAGRESGVENGGVLLELAEAVVGRDVDAIARARRGVIDALSVEAMVDAAAVASNFERMVRIADSTGIPLGERLETLGREVIEELGLEWLAGR